MATLQTEGCKTESRSDPNLLSSVTMKFYQFVAYRSQFLDFDLLSAVSPNSDMFYVSFKNLYLLNIFCSLCFGQFILAR